MKLRWWCDAFKINFLCSSSLFASYLTWVQNVSSQIFLWSERQEEMPGTLNCSSTLPPVPGLQKGCCWITAAPTRSEQTRENIELGPSFKGLLENSTDILGWCHIMQCWVTSRWVPASQEKATCQPCSFDKELTSSFRRSSDPFPDSLVGFCSHPSCCIESAEYPSHGVSYIPQYLSSFWRDHSYQI